MENKNIGLIIVAVMVLPEIRNTVKMEISVQ